MSKNLIVKDNKLIESRYNLTLTEVKIFSKLVSMNYRESENFLEYKISVKDLLSDLKIHQKNHKEIKLAINKLLSRVINITKINSDGDIEEIGLQILAKSKFNIKTSTYNLMIHSDLKEYLLQLRENFTQYELENILQLRSFYSFRIYELLKMNEFKKKVKYSIEEIKEFLDINKNQYKMYSAFRTYILDKAKEDIKEFTDIYFLYKPIKSSRKITHIEFKIIKKDKKQLENKSEQQTKYSDETEALYKLLPKAEQIEIRKAELENLLKKHTFKYLEFDINYCNIKAKENYWGLFVKSAKDGHYGKAAIGKAEKKKELQEQTKEKEKHIEEENKRKKQLLEEMLKNPVPNDIDEFERDYENMPIKNRTKEEYFREFIIDRYELWLEE